MDRDRHQCHQRNQLVAKQMCRSIFAFLGHASSNPRDSACLYSIVGYVRSGKTQWGASKMIIDDAIDYSDYADYSNDTPEEEKDRHVLKPDTRSLSDSGILGST